MLIGDGAGSGITTATNNVVVGADGGVANQTGSNNVYVGYLAGPASGVSGSIYSTVAVGYQASSYTKEKVLRLDIRLLSMLVRLDLLLSDTKLETILVVIRLMLVCRRVMVFLMTILCLLDIRLVIMLAVKILFGLVGLGFSSTGATRSIGIGKNAGQSSSSSDSVYIGKSAGQSNSVDDMFLLVIIHPLQTAPCLKGICLIRD